MTRVVGVWLGLGLLGAAAAAQAGPALKIGYINGTQVLQQTPGYTAAESTFDRASSKLQYTFRF